MTHFSSEESPESEKVISWLALQIERIALDLRDEALKLGDEERVVSFTRALPVMLEVATMRVGRKLNATNKEID